MENTPAQTLNLEKTELLVECSVETGFVAYRESEEEKDKGEGRMYS
jgi:hypothetical protein